MLQAWADHDGQLRRACMRYAWYLGLVAHDLLLIDWCRSLRRILLIEPSISTRALSTRGLSTRSAHLAANSGILVTLHSLNLKRAPLPIVAGIIGNTGRNVHTSSKSSDLVERVVLRLVFSASSFPLG